MPGQVNGPTVLLPMVVVAIATAASDSEGYCPPSRNTPDLAFVDSYPLQPVVKEVSTFFYLSCCTGGRPGVNTSWYRWDEDSQHWCFIPNCSDTDYRHTSNGGQILAFEEAGVLDDTGKYLCNATDGRSTISRTFDVVVVDCKSNQGKIISTKPSHPQALVGSVFSQPCEGDFGCLGAVANDSKAWWAYVDEQGHLHNLSVGTLGRYSIKETISEDETKKGAVLTIHGVTEKDFHRKFVCSLQMRGSVTDGFSFKLTETGAQKELLFKRLISESKETLQKFIPLIAGLAALAVVVVLAVVLTHQLCAPSVAFLWRSATGRLPARGERHKYDVMLKTGDLEDEKVINTLQTWLQQSGYKLYTAHPNASEVKQMDDIAECVTVIFLISSTQEEEPFAEFSLYFSICKDSNSNVIFIPMQDLSESEWNKLATDYKKLCKEIPKLCTIAKWPQEGGRLAKLRWKNFWSKLQSSLPKSQGVEEQNEVNASHPLLEESSIYSCEDVDPSPA